MATVTGLSQLGQALSQGAGDYANIQLRRQQEERQRAQQIADLQDQRRYAEDVRGFERSLGLEDEQRRREQAIDAATLEILLKEGWLKPTDARNPEAIQAAADARQARIGTARTREDALPGRLQSEADYLGQQEAELSAAEDQLNAVLSAPQPGPPSNAEVRTLAIRMTGKPVPSDAEINGMMQAAADAIAQQRYMEWDMERRNAQAQIPLLRSQRMALRQSLSGLLQQGIVPNRTPPPSPASSLGAAPAAPRAATPEEMAAAAGVATPAPAPVSGPASLQSQEYGGLRSVLPNLQSVGAALQNPAGAAEIAFRAGVSQPMGRGFDTLMGGERQAAEGDVARAASMADAVSRFNAPSAPLPANPFYQGDFMSPQPSQLSRLPALPPMRKPPSQSPAFQFSNSYAPGN